MVQFNTSEANAKVDAEQREMGLQFQVCSV